MKKDRKSKFVVPEDILAELKKDGDVWKHFETFPEAYKRVRIGWIDASRKRPDEFAKRLRYFLKMTKSGKKYGAIK